MKVIYNKVIPINGYKCVNLFGVLFVREGCTMTATDYNHEAIHTTQMKELLYVPFYLLYVLEWLWYLIRLRDTRAAYRAISFEREAYAHEGEADYLKTRKKFNQYRMN
jgi:hypothetical protein